MAGEHASGSTAFETEKQAGEEKEKAKEGGRTRFRRQKRRRGEERNGKATKRRKDKVQGGTALETAKTQAGEGKKRKGK